MATGFASKEVDERADDHATDGGDRDAPIPGHLLRDFQGIAGFGGHAFFEDGGDSVETFEGKALDYADHQPEEDGADRSGEADKYGADDHVEVAAAFEELAGISGRLRQTGSLQGSEERSAKLALTRLNAVMDRRLFMKRVILRLG